MQYFFYIQVPSSTDDRNMSQHALTFHASLTPNCLILTLQICQYLFSLSVYDTHTVCLLYEQTARSG